MKPEVRVDHVGPHWVVTVVGEHDISTAGGLEASLREVQQHGSDVVVDLAGATFIDSTVVAVIVRHARLPGEQAAIVAPTGTAARRVIDRVHMDTIVAVCETDEEAVRRLRR